MGLLSFELPSIQTLPRNVKGFIESHFLLKFNFYTEVKRFYIVIFTSEIY